MHLTCDTEIDVTINGHKGAHVHEYLRTEIRWERVHPDDNWWVVVPEDADVHDEFYDDLNARLDVYRSELTKVYPVGGFLADPAEELYVRDSFVETSEDPSCSYFNSTAIKHLVDLHFSNEGYTTELKERGDVTYVHVESPMGSSVSYSIPTAYLVQIFSFAFADGDALELHWDLTSWRNSTTGSESYTLSFAESLLESGHEAVSFSLAVDDYEGRQELRPVIAKAIEVAASQYEGFSVATMHVYMSNGQQAVATATAEGGEIEIQGWSILASGGLSGSGDGIDLEYEYQSWYEEIIRGSVYVSPLFDP